MVAFMITGRAQTSLIKTARHQEYGASADEYTGNFARTSVAKGLEIENSHMIETVRCDGKCSSAMCRRMGGGWYVYASNGKQGFDRYETVKMGPFTSQEEAQAAGEREWPYHMEVSHDPRRKGYRAGFTVSLRFYSQFLLRDPLYSHPFHRVVGFLIRDICGN